MSIRELLDDGGATVESWKRLKVASIRASDVEVIPGTNAITSNYAEFSGLKFRAAAAVGASNITGAAANADIKLTFVRSSNVWNISIECFANGTDTLNYDFHATADSATFITRQALVATELALSNFINANLFPAGVANNTRIVCPVTQFTAGRAVTSGAIVFVKTDVALDVCCRLGSAANFDTLLAAQLMSPSVVSAPTL